MVPSNDYLNINVICYKFTERKVKLTSISFRKKIFHNKNTDSVYVEFERD